jgi:hypothetical protein
MTGMTGMEHLYTESNLEHYIRLINSTLPAPTYTQLHYDYYSAQEKNEKLLKVLPPFGYLNCKLADVRICSIKFY